MTTQVLPLHVAVRLKDAITAICVRVKRFSQNNQNERNQIMNIHAFAIRQIEQLRFTTARSIALILAVVGLTAFPTVNAADTASTTNPSDAEIAMIVVVADTVDINYGKLAVEKTKNQGVKEFAETMVRDHTAV